MRAQGARHEHDRSQGPRHRRLQGHPGHRDLRQAGRRRSPPRIRSSRSNRTRRRWTCPSPAAGTVREVTVKLGDKVSEGTADRRARSRRRASAPAQPTQPARRLRRAPRPRRAAPRHGKTPAPARGRAGAPTYTGKVDVECGMLVLGAGPGGYSAAFRAADLGMKTVLVERYRGAGRRVPQRRLHSVEGAAAHRGGDGRDEDARRRTASRSARRRSTSTSCAAGRTRSSAS